MGVQVESYYQKLASLIVEMIPEEWTEVKFYAQMDEEGSKVSFFYYQSSKTKQWINDMTITEKFQFPEEDFRELEKELSFCISDFKKEYQEELEEPWMSFQMNLRSNGKFNINFSYEVNPLGPTKTKAIWAYEHLGVVPSEDSFNKTLLDEYLEEKAKGKRYPFLEPVKEEQ